MLHYYIRLEIAEKLVPNMHSPLKTIYSARRGRLFEVLPVNRDALGTICHNSFKWSATRMFNSLPKYLRNISNCGVNSFKSKLDYYLNTLRDDPTTTHESNGVDKRIQQQYLDGGHLVMA